MSAILSAVAYASTTTTRRTGDRDIGGILRRILKSALPVTAAAGGHRRIGGAVETAVETALGSHPRTGSVVNAALAMAPTHRSRHEAVLDTHLSPPLRKLLRRSLFEPIHAAVRLPVGAMLHPGLNAVPSNLAPLGVLLSGWVCYGAPAWAGSAGELDYANAVLGVPLDRTFIDTLECCGFYLAA